MSAKDGKNDPQDTPRDAVLFPMDDAEKQRVYKRMVDNFSRIEYLRHKQADDSKTLREEIDSLTRLNRALLKELGK